MKGYLFALFLLTICVIRVEPAPTSSDKADPLPRRGKSKLHRDSVFLKTPIDEADEEPPFESVSSRDSALLKKNPVYKQMGRFQ